MKSNNTVCPVCSNGDVKLFLERKQVPIHQNLLITNQVSARTTVRGDLELYVCPSCGFIYNRAFDKALLSYNDRYDNTQACSPLFSKYLHDLVKHLIVDRGVKNRKIIEVGCGKGQFLMELCESEEVGNTGIGFDPSYIGEDEISGGRIRFEKRFYDTDCIEIPVDVVICRHVIEHIPNPLDLLRDIKSALVNSPCARVFFETPCVEWILGNKVIWDFFYEHCSYFTRESLTTAFETSGFQVESVSHIFGGQYLWLEASIPDEKPPITKNPHLITYLAKEFSASEKDLIKNWTIKIKKLASKGKGKLALWGAGAKGVTFANLIDPDCKLIDCVVDLNSKKQGNYISGTGHTIVSYHELTNRNVRYAILMNPNYRSENKILLREAHIDIELIE